MIWDKTSWTHSKGFLFRAVGDIGGGPDWNRAFNYQVHNAVGPRSLDPFSEVTYFIKWVKISWTDSTHCMGQDFLDMK